MPSFVVFSLRALRAPARLALLAALLVGASPRLAGAEPERAAPHPETPAASASPAEASVPEREPRSAPPALRVPPTRASERLRIESIDPRDWLRRWGRVERRPLP
jgi:hypothetical protein